MVTFVGSDDVIAVERLQRIVDRLPSFALPSVIYSDPIYITKDTTTVEPEPSSRSFRPTGFILKYLLMGQFNFMGGPIAAPKACFVSAGPYDEELTWGEEFEMSLRLAKNYPFVFDPLCTYGYRIYEGNILNRISKAWVEAAVPDTRENHTGRHRRFETRREENVFQLSLQLLSGQRQLVEAPIPRVGEQGSIPLDVDAAHEATRVAFHLHESVRTLSVNLRDA